VTDILERMAVLADGIRSRLLLVLERQELAVSELCAVLQLPQSTVSRHLKLLADEGLVSSRAEGTTRRYRARASAWEAPTRKLWTLVREQLSDAPAAAQDAHRLEGVLARRRTRSEEFFSGAAGQWDRLREELFGTRVHLQALLAMLDSEWVVGDLGCGTGHVSEALAPFVRRVIAVDASAAMLNAARKRLTALDNVEVRRGELEALPLADAELDAATMFLVLGYLAEPDVALADAARVLRVGGRLVVLDMMPHDREQYREEMGHAWLGFARDQMKSWLESAGMEMRAYRSLRAEEGAKGPGLFVASAIRI
jgi:ubiquinone/menaquinone biosynthesis C-methylase UbiE